MDMCDRGRARQPAPVRFDEQRIEQRIVSEPDEAGACCPGDFWRQVGLVDDSGLGDPCRQGQYDCMTDTADSLVHFPFS